MKMKGNSTCSTPVILWLPLVAAVVSLLFSQSYVVSLHCVNNPHFAIFPPQLRQIVFFNLIL